MSTARNIQDLLDLLSGKGRDAFFGEVVSVLDHSLQCAYFAERSQAGPFAVTAALLHDIGHLLPDLPRDLAQPGREGWHEEIGAAQLSPWFGVAVAEPVRLHVAAKRYLCATDPGYVSQLSQASIESLQVQGGPMRPEEVHAFDALAGASLAVQLRRWDEAAKIPDLRVPRLEHYLPFLRTALRDSATA